MMLDMKKAKATGDSLAGSFHLVRLGLKVDSGIGKVL